jgi:uncharacterized protein involved in response to NO
MTEASYREYGANRRTWLLSGMVLCVVGCLAVIVSIVVLTQSALWSAKAVAISTGFFLLGLLFVANGIFIISRREQLKILLSDESIIIGTLHGYDRICYRCIMRVSQGVDCVLLHLIQGKVYSILDSYFNSFQERENFIQDLQRRIRLSQMGRDTSAG